MSDCLFRGTTPTLKFTLPLEVSTLSDAWITLAQNGCEVITKKLADCNASGDTLTLTLTQDETLMLTGGARTEIQIRVKTGDGKALASEIFSESTHRILKDGVI